MNALRLPSYVDSSMLSSWRACKRKFFWSYLNALYPQGKSVHLIAGGAFAAGMEAARRLAFQGIGDHRPLHDDLLQAALKAFIREWGDYIPPEDSNKSFENTFQALSEYLLAYPPETDPIQPYRSPDGKAAVEFTFSIPLDEGPKHPETGDPFLFVGRFDMLGSWQGLPCVVDEKTTEAMGTYWQRQWSLRGQFMGYCWACQHLGLNVNTAVISGIAIQKTQFKFQRVIEQFPQYLLERWYNQLLIDLGGIVNSYRLLTETTSPAMRQVDADIFFPYNFADSCSSYGGCPFVPLCLAKNPEDYFSNYTRFVWDPLAKQGIKELEEVA